ncbi:MAG: hypothetical protein RBT25_04845 [Lentisphaeria bacterium]|nr:hypothetical protein [Lentisphaeria bacterium]
MAKYDVKCEKCGCEFVTHLVGNQSSRRWKLENWEWICASCKEAEKLAERQAAADKALAEAKEAGLPELQGSDKQVSWAAQIRAEFMTLEFTDINMHLALDGHLQPHKTAISLMGDAGVAKLFNNAKASLAQNTSASWWIDRREKLGGTIGAAMAEALQPKKEEEMDDTTRAWLEARGVKVRTPAPVDNRELLEPETVRHQVVCKIDLWETGRIEIELAERIEEFRLLARAAGFVWERPHWVDMNGPCQEAKAVFVAAKALELGIRVLVPPHVAAAVKAGRVYSRIVHYAGDFRLEWWADDWYAKCRSLPEAKWDKPQMRVPSLYWAEVADFAQTNGFLLSMAAQTAIDQGRTPEKVAPAFVAGEELPLPPAGDGIAESLKDD